MRSLFYLGLVLANLFGSSAHADDDAEREALAHLVHEIEVLQTLIDRAEQAADDDARVHFRYDWLRQDLERVRSGIQEHIDAPRNEPRAVKPLRGDYRH